ncbi:uncharacterized protein LOC111335057 [Stylophora pistillata]|uniref:uncharacterized protein LOC111335057 n=1 Tax=Stylophora pistillata TaxID=50429 RepID=UPI000C04239E|nr:uncharacterized protein LOC111335057 [Stylophora pistillata]
MNEKLLVLVLSLTFVPNAFHLGLCHKHNSKHHAFWREKNSPDFVRRTSAHLRDWKRIVEMEKKDTSRKRGFSPPLKKDEIAKNEILVKELALSSFVGDVRNLKKKVTNKKRKITKKIHPKSKTRLAIRATSTAKSTQKRTSIMLPSASGGRSQPEHAIPISRTLVTALGLLLNEKNHFVKDSNALSLAKVLLDNDNTVNQEHESVGSDPQNSKAELPLDFGSKLLRLLNTSSLRNSASGERKSTIHTELINPTELGISILRLLFGRKAHLVTKPTYKPLLRYNPTDSSSRIKLLPQTKELDKGNAMIRTRKHHKKSFSFALAKAVSDLIKSMAKEELKNYLRKMHDDPKFTKGISLSRVPDSLWPSKKVVDVQGNRKSWVLLKIPKSGESLLPNADLSDEPLQEKETDVDNETESEKKPAGIVDTLGKLNDAQPSSKEALDKDIGEPSKETKNKSFASDSKVRPTTKVGYSVRILPSLKGTAEKLNNNYRTNRKPQSAAQTTAAFAEAVKKLLQAVQSSIKSLQGKHVINYPTDLTPREENQHINLQNVPYTRTGSVRAIKKDPVSLHYVEPTIKSQFIQDIPVHGKANSVELSASTRGAGQEYRKPQKTLFDPLKDLEMSPSEPITKSSSQTKALGPSDNVLFESATEIGTPKDKQEFSTAEHIKEDLETFAEKGLEAHNHYRQEHHSSNLRWSDVLATQAEKMAYDMAMRGTVERSELAESMGYGENVAKITGVPFNDAGAVATDLWYSESRNYSYSYPRVIPQTDAFTQLVWKGTKEIGMGCAKDVATNDLYVVALYKPPGNDRKRLRDNVLNKGTMTEDVYATIFKRAQMLSNSTLD